MQSTEPPLVVADELGVHTHRGWVFEGLSFQAEAGQLVAIAGPGGSGRTAVLLTLGGRMRASAGVLRVGGLLLPEHAGRVRALTAVARIGGAVTLDKDLRVGDLVRERALMTRCSRGTFGPACSVLEVSFEERAVVGSLEAHQVTLLALALALMEGRQIVFLDDLDTGSDSGSQAWLWAAARRAADTGVCLIATTVDGSLAEPYAQHVVSLYGEES
jgi:ABC-type multidrug transport system ATPase subunit